MLVIGALQETPQERLDGHYFEVLTTDQSPPDRTGNTVSFEAEVVYGKRRNGGKTVLPSRTSRTSG